MNRLPVIFAIAVATLVLAGVVVYRNLASRNNAEPAPVAAERAPARGEARPEAPAAPPPSVTADRPAAKRAPGPKTTAPTPTPVAAPSEVGTLTIVSDVPGAQVFLDRAFVGATPVTANDIKPGPHQLNASLQGYDAYVEHIEVSPGTREIMIKFREVRLDTALDVVHKHRMGSCRGRLVATAQGLRYETTDKDDAFGAPLLELETFQMDYLNKNLRIQPRKGKRYDFTDPDGNADRLFVFHRDVDRARERLKKGDLPAGQ